MLQGVSAAARQGNPGSKHTGDEEEQSADGDEPPDRPIQFSKMVNTSSHSSGSEGGCITSPRYRKASLLTQALTSPELTPLSDVEAPLLTSDGGMTSPARTSTPSPPLLVLGHTAITSLEHKNSIFAKQRQASVQLPQALTADKTQEVTVEESLGRRRCISFACVQKKPPTENDKAPQERAFSNDHVSEAALPPKRPCTLRFACSMKPSRSELQKTAKHDGIEDSSQNLPILQNHIRFVGPLQSQTTIAPPEKEMRSSNLRDPNGDERKNFVVSPLSPSAGVRDGTLQFNRVDFQKSEATRFHEFAGSFTEEGEWANEQTAFREKITINDTLRKENAIRKLAEEAEEEAEDEDEDAYVNADDDIDEPSDDGNETDDEDGFADSDDESDSGSTYQFWTLGYNTAATSTDQMEHIRPTSHRVPSESSIESVMKGKVHHDEPFKLNGKKNRKVRRSRRTTRPDSPDLLDSSEFVVGTIDEDQPLEEEYMSRLKQRERSKQKIIPQDIDPSFPTSDPEADNDDDEVENERDYKANKGLQWTVDRAPSSNSDAYDDNESDDDNSASQQPGGTKRIATNPSPRRLHSPPPPSRRLFGQAVHRLRSPPPTHRRLVSPPSSRRPSLNGSPGNAHGLDITRLAQRPNLTHTTSLPRTPNPFWSLHRRSQFHGSEIPSAGTSPKPSHSAIRDGHGRGPIEIVQGLENKRQRRKEKFSRHHCQKAHAGKEKERKCQPGQGAQRMREVGLVMADRWKGYKQDTKLVLSV